MHPEKPMQEGQLPPWQARCFIHRQRADETLFEEIALRATTVWFFPHREQMMLIWQGHIRINEDDAADVLQLIPALEKRAPPVRLITIARYWPSEWIKRRARSSPFVKKISYRKRPSARGSTMKLNSRRVRSRRI